MDYSKEHYYEAYERDGFWSWRIYHYDATGNREILVAESGRGYDKEGQAQDAVIEWLDEHPEIDAQLA